MAAAAREEDIDALLAEIEGTLGAGEAAHGPAGAAALPPPAPPPPRASASASAAPAPSGGGGGGAAAPEDELDALLGELAMQGGASPPAAPPALGRSAAPADAPAPAARLRAKGGSSSALSLSEPPPRVDGLAYGRTAMRCTKCDFRVYVFDARAWAHGPGGVDYMLLRNYMPDASRLLHALRPAVGTQAYACQCAWSTADEWERPSVASWRTMPSLVADSLS